MKIHATELVIFGATDFARVARRLAEATRNYVVRAFVVDRGWQDVSDLDGLPVVDGSDLLTRFPPTQFSMFVASGYKSMRGREYLYSRWKAQGYCLENIHGSGSNVAPDVELGDNNIFFPGVVIEPGAKVGNNNVVWSNSTICHDSKFGDHNFVAAGTTIGGNVLVGSLCFFGFGCVVLNGLTLGNEVLIGAQSLVTQNADNLWELRGTPARPLRRVESEVGIRVG